MSIEFHVQKADDADLFVVHKSAVEEPDTLGIGANAKAAAVDFLIGALKLASEHLKGPEIAAIIRTEKLKSGGK